MRIPRGVKWATVEWLETDFLIIISKAQLDKICKQLKDPPDFLVNGWGNAGLCFVLDWGDSKMPCVMIQDKNFITHEATHLAEELLEIHNIPYRAKNMFEVRAYMIQHVDNLIRKALGI